MQPIVYPLCSVQCIVCKWICFYDSRSLFPDRPKMDSAAWVSEEKTECSKTPDVQGHHLMCGKSQSHMITYPVLLFIIIFRSAGLEIGGFNVTLGTKLLHSLSGLTLVNYRSTILTHHLGHHNYHCNCNCHSSFLPQIITVLLDECNPITNA